MKLLKEEIVTMKILRQQGESNEAIAQRLGVTGRIVVVFLAELRLYGF